jgi:tripartite-type tricarboxylate transporter receptor subunit TctC
MSMKKIIAAAAVVLSVAAHAFEAPRTVTVTTGFGPGSGNEVSFRAVAAIVEKQNPGTSYVVMQKPGGDEVVALNWFTAQNPVPGNNIYITSHQGPFTTMGRWYRDQMTFDPMKLEFVTTIAKSPLAVIAKSSSQTNTPKQLIERLRNTRETIYFGIGAGAHRLAFEYLVDKSNGNRDLVKSAMYRGPAQALNDVAGGHVEFAIVPTAVAYGMYKSGQVKYIGLAGEQRLSLIPEVPLMQDTVPGMNVYAAWSIVLPPGSSPAQVKFYQDQFVPAIRSAEAKKFFEQNLMFTVPEEHSPEGMRRHIIDLRKQWLPYVEQINLD